MREALIIAGANGAGKTTFARNFIPAVFPNAVFLNADEIQRERRAFQAPLAAGRELIKRLDQTVRQSADFVIETTLSSRQYARRIPEWKAAGYRVALIFLEVPSADFAVERVAKRVANGGHDIPEPDIRRRFVRGRLLFEGTFQNIVDVWYHYVWNGDAYVLYQKGP